MADTQIVKSEVQGGAQKTYSVSYVIGALIVGIFAGTLLSFVWFKTGTSPAPVTTPEQQTASTSDSETEETATVSSPSESADEPETVTNPGGVLSIEDQPAGVSVTVAQAQVSSDQWVVIREVKNGQPSNVLGAARFVGGATSGTVELLRATTAGVSYYGVIYKDNGDRLFSLADDTPLPDASGNPILVSFTAR